MSELVLYQFDSCPFCWKVKALMRSQGLEFQAVEVDPMKKAEVRAFGYEQVPVLKDGETVLAESSDILDYLSRRYADLPEKDGENTWRSWVDDSLVHLLPPLIHANFSTSFKSFGKILKASGMKGPKAWLVRFGGAVAMSKVAKRKAAERGIENAEQDLKDAIDRWMDEAVADQAFYGGENPSLADLSVWGVLRSTQGMGPVEDLKAHRADFADWYQRCAERSGE